jgi:hypothetical protein
VRVLALGADADRLTGQADKVQTLHASGRAAGAGSGSRSRLAKEGRTRVVVVQSTVRPSGRSGDETSTESFHACMPIFPPWESLL